MAKVVWTEEARRWLQEIYDYIAEDSEESAYRTVCAIHERAGMVVNISGVPAARTLRAGARLCCSLTLRRLLSCTPSP